MAEHSRGAGRCRHGHRRRGENHLVPDALRKFPEVRPGSRKISRQPPPGLDAARDLLARAAGAPRRGGGDRGEGVRSGQVRTASFRAPGEQGEAARPALTFFPPGGVMLKLWGRINSINVQKVLWALAELNVPYERTDAGLQFGVVNEPFYRRMNPNGRAWATFRSGRSSIAGMRSR